MDQTVEVIEALKSRAKEKTIDELGKKGKSFKVIKPSDIAAMIQEAVERTIKNSGYIAPEEAEKLIEESKKEFKNVVEEREKEKIELEKANERIKSLEALLEEKEKRITSLEKELDKNKHEVNQSMQSELIVRLMSEINDLKMKMNTGNEPKPEGDSAIAEKLANVINSLEGKIEKIGKKVGINEAVEGEEIKFDSLFEDHGTQDDMETNLDNLEVKERKGEGIAANLERIKKLKGIKREKD